MALSNSNKNQIEVMIRKEIKSFLNANTVKQFESKIVDTIKDEIRRGKIQGDVTDIVTKVMREFYKIMWTQRSFWEPTLRRVK
jgi:anti-sigma28 factor (negative regulator of flagellin synthesis)